MWAYIARRLLGLIPVLLGITLLVFVVFHFTQDPVQVVLGVHGSPAQQAALRHDLGLDRPVLEQYWTFLTHLLRGDMGQSWMLRRPVLPEILHRIPHTIELTLAAMLITVVIGLVVGIVSAIRPNSVGDAVGMVGSLTAMSMPVYWLGLILISYLAARNRIFPMNGAMDPVLLSNYKGNDFYIFWSLFTGHWTYLKDAFWHLVLPACTLAAATTALLARMTRGAMIEVIRQDFIRTARAKGLSGWVTVWKHALKNALIPILTVIGLQVGGLLSGAVLTETVFTWPGVGTLTTTAVFNQDLPLVQGSVLVVAVLFVLVNLVVDLLYAWVDPRIHYS